MICPICGGEMEEGGLIASGIRSCGFHWNSLPKRGWSGFGMRAESQSESRTTFSTIPGFPARITAAAARK